MKSLSLIIFVCSLYYVNSNAVEDISPFNYHAKIGIPRAEKIKQIETDYYINNASKIVGGSVSPVEAVPYQVGLIIEILSSSGNSVCGGSLISNNKVITAAHCWYDGVNQAWRFTVVLGSATLFYGGGERIPTTTFSMHSSWTPSTVTNDVGIATLPYAVTYTTAIQAIALPSGSAALSDYTGYYTIASGYGKTDDSQSGVTQATVISAVTLQVITNAVCQQSFGTVFVTSGTLCTRGTGGVGICGGDSGGPLVAVYGGQRVLIGISSFVASRGCQLGFPSAFTRVTSFLNWILNNM